MLHSLNPLQDENSQPYVTNKRLATDATRKLLGPAGGTPLSKQAGLSSARKALGNITNRATHQQENATPFKNTPAVPGHRKALGDITNASAAGTGLASRPLLDKQAQRSSIKPKLAKHKSKAEIYAKDGVERLAGKSCAQLEADRELRDVQDASSRAAHFASLYARPRHVLHWSKVCTPFVIAAVFAAGMSGRNSMCSLSYPCTIPVRAFLRIWAIWSWKLWRPPYLQNHSMTAQVCIHAVYMRPPCNDGLSVLCLPSVLHKPVS